MNTLFKIKMIALASLSLLPTITYAQGSSGSGNGGKLVICNTQLGSLQVKKVTPLDYWEAQQESTRIQISLGGPRLSADQKVNLIIKRIRRLDPAFAKELSTLFAEFQILKDISSTYKINRIDDTKKVVDQSALITPSESCVERQGAVQIREIDQIFNKKFFIDEVYWKMMDEDAKAGLIFHEVLYWSEIKRGALNSFGTRKLNAIFSSTLADKLLLMEYLQLMRRYSLRDRYRLKGVDISFSPNDPIEFSLNGQLAHGRLVAAVQANVMGRNYVCSAGERVEFDDQGQIVNCLVQDVEWNLVRQSFEETISFSGPALELKQIEGLDSILSFSKLQWKLKQFSYRSSNLNLSNSEYPDLEVKCDETWSLTEFRSSHPSAYQHWLDQTPLHLQNLKLLGAKVDPVSGQISELSVTKGAEGGAPYLINRLNGKKYELSWKPVLQVKLLAAPDWIGEIE